MQNQTVSRWTSKLRRSETPARRVAHGGIAWSAPVAARTLRQPQDGTPDTRSRVASIAARLNDKLTFEPEDASLTGGTRSLNRRLMGLNVMKQERKGPGVATVGPQTRVA
jgi:hypothetical protein